MSEGKSTVLRIDAHQHFWGYNPTDYVWMGPEMQTLKRDYGPSELRPQLDAIGFTGSVAVQARQMETETEYLLALARVHSWILGVVGWVDFTHADLPSRLERYADNPRLKGVRELIHDMPDPDYAVSPTHLRAVGELARFKLTYDLLLRPPHLDPALRLVDHYPHQPFVIDHIAKPAIRSGEREPWEAGMRELSRRPNVWCKLSGMVTEASWTSWGAEDLTPYLDICLECFGPERLMIGSDWPVCTLAGSYQQVMSVVINWAGSLSSSERDMVLGGTCARFYGL